MLHVRNQFFGRLCSEEAESVAQFVVSERSVSIFSCGASAPAAHAAARDCGARILVDAARDDAPARWDNAIHLGDAVIVELEATDPPFEALLERASRLAKSATIPIVANVTPGALDTVAARLYGPRVTLMSEATFADHVAALTIALLPPRAVMNEAGVNDALRLQRLADEVGRIARTLSDLAGHEPTAFSDAMIGYRAPPPAPRASTAAITAAEIRGIIRLRRLRDQYFRGELFADPAWDMMLDLLAARLEHLRVAVSSLCIAAAVPPTTALRWIRTMTDAGLFVRLPDPGDARRVFIDLSESAAESLTRYLAHARQSGALAI